MRILQVNKYLFRRGGAESYLFDLADLLRAAGHQVAFFGMSHPDNIPLPYADWFPREVEFDPPPTDPISRARAVSRMMWSGSARRGLAAVIRDFRPDVVHCHNIYHQLSPSILGAATAAGVPVVMTLHDYKMACPTYRLLDNGHLCEACIPGHFSHAFKRGCRNHSRTQSGLMALELALHTWTGAYGAVARFVCPSRFLEGVMRRANVFPERLEVIPNFCNGLQAIAPRAFDRDGAEGGPVVFAGRLSPEKGVRTLIDAMASHPELECVIAGDGPDRGRLAEAAAPLGSRIAFTGRLGRSEVLDLIRRASSVAVPSIWHENQPIVVLEAFACGVPVVCTDLGGLPELVRDEMTGLVVPPGDAAALGAAVARQAGDGPTAAVMGSQARAYVEECHDPGRHLDAIVGLYRRVGA